MEMSHFMKRSCRLTLIILLVLLAGCANEPPSTLGTQARPSTLGTGTQSATPPAELAPDCGAKRLPDLVLSDDIPAPHGVEALDPVTGPTDGVIGFDQALIRACEEDPWDAKTVQVVLGSADPEARHWETTDRLFYGVAWGGVTQCAGGLSFACSSVTAGTIIDALTGAFIVGGS